MNKSIHSLLTILLCSFLSDGLFAQTINFTGEELLGCPSDNSIRINVVPASDIELYYEYGTSPGVYTAQTTSVMVTGGQPGEVVITGLSPNTLYYYRMQYRYSEGSWIARSENSFHTRRPAGSNFVFTITSDSHAQFNASHRQAMTNIKTDHPDFHIDLGDTYYVDNTTSQSQVDNKYLAYRNVLYMGAIGPSVPIFLSSGNHENEEGWNFDDTPFSISLGSVQSRKAYYPTPIPDGFYSGNDDLLTAINASVYGDQYREDYYAWTWGDALFVVIDPFQYTMNLPYNPTAGEGTDDVMTGDQWSWTLGKKQFNWFKQVIQSSQAKYKFVFSHQMTGGIPNLTIAGAGPGYVRGGAGAAPYFEWGGKNSDGSEGFASHRNEADFGTTPIHQLMVQNGVSAYFHGHDHMYVYESLDGVVYQEVPSPGLTGSGFAGIYSESNPFTHKILPNAGHLRISITPDLATVDYVRSDKTEVSYSYNIQPNNSTPTQYTISAISGPNGSITPSGDILITKGNNQNFNIVPDNGYAVFDVLVDDKSVGTLTSYTFNNVQANHRITASFTSSPPAQPGGITGNSTVCQGSIQTYSILPVTGATSYNWTLPSGWSGSSSSVSITATAGPGSETVYVSASNSIGSSDSSTLNISVSSIPQQPNPITGNTSVCQGSSQTYTISPVPGATSYNWILPSGWTGSSTSTSITATTGANSGTISVTATNSCGTGASRTLSVSSSSIPAQPGAITGNTSVCQGSSQTYTISPVPGATSYNWTLPSGWTGSSTSTSITATTGTNSGTISVTATNSCGTGASRTLSVSSSSIPAQPGAITGNASVCQGSSQTYTISPVPGATSYNWTLPSGWTGSSTSTSITATTGANSGTISVTATNSCGTGASRTLSVSSSSIPAQPEAITGNTSVCQGSSQTYTISPVPGATSYNWTLPSGWTGSSTSTSITATTGANSGTISVTATNSCGTGTSRTLSVSSSSIPPQPGAITGNASVCQGSSQTYTISPVPGATSYNWTLPSGWTGSSTSTSITATTGANSGTISVTAANSCGTGASRTLSVSSSSIPAQPGAITGNASVCQGSSQTYTISPVPGATSYNWTLPSGWSGNSASTSISATAGANGGTITVTAENSCGPGASRTLNLSVPLTPDVPTVSIIQPTCNTAEGIITVTAPKGPGISYSINSTDYSNTSGIFTGISSGDYNVTAKSPEGCISISRSITINSQPLKPSTPIITLSGNTLHSSAFTGNQWYNQSGLINGASGQNYTAIADGYYYVIVTNGVCVSDQSNTISVILTGLMQQNINKTITTYPNPSDGGFTLCIPGEMMQDSEIEILNVNGQILRTEKLEMNMDQIKINLSEFSKGTYFIRIKYHGNTVTKTVILK